MSAQSPAGAAPEPDVPQQGGNDRGSVTPLVIGMVLCLLIIGAGVIAAGSAYLARRQLQSLCDGAATLAAGRVTFDDAGNAPDGAYDRSLAEYMAIRHPDVTARSVASDDSVVARCERDASITFGAMFGNPTLHITVDSISALRRN